MNKCLKTGCVIEIDTVLYRADMHLIDGYLVFTRNVKPFTPEDTHVDVKIFNHGTEYPKYPTHDEIRFVQVPIESPEKDIEISQKFKEEMLYWNSNHRILLMSVGTF